MKSCFKTVCAEWIHTVFCSTVASNFSVSLCAFALKVFCFYKTVWTHTRTHSHIKNNFIQSWHCWTNPGKCFHITWKKAEHQLSLGDAGVTPLVHSESLSPCAVRGEAPPPVTWRDWRVVQLWPQTPSSWSSLSAWGRPAESGRTGCWRCPGTWSGWGKRVTGTCCLQRETAGTETYIFYIPFQF